MFDDADLELAAATASRAVFNNSGQVCLAGTRVLVHRSVYPEFLERLTDHARQLTVGDPMQAETDLGPLATVAPFDTTDEALSLANDTAYGLSSVVFTESLARAHTAASHLRSGTVWVNCYQIRDLRAPFGGVGNSGVGREDGSFSREFYTEPQAVFLVTTVR